MCNVVICSGVEKVTWDVFKPSRGKWWRVARTLHRYDGPLVQYPKQTRWRIRWHLYYGMSSKYATREEAEAALAVLGARKRR